jgi:anti-sigma factor RsiW
MAHGITEQDWMRFIDGEATGIERRRVEDHLSMCAACAAQAAELRSWRVQLRAEGHRLSSALAGGEAQLEALLEDGLARVRAAGHGAGAGWSVREGLSLLRSVMEPLCGTGATQAAMSLAIRRSAGFEEELGGNNWDLFVVNLREATTSVCGIATGRLVSRAGSCLQIAA